MNTYAVPPKNKYEQLLEDSLKGLDKGVLYKAKVLDNSDPDRQGRVKLELPFYRGMSTEEIPWAKPCYFASGYNSGSYWVPEIGCYVWVAFEKGDEFKPVYIGGAYQQSNSEGYKIGDLYQAPGVSGLPQEVVDTNCTILYKSRTGCKIAYDEDKKNLNLQGPDETGMLISEGEIELYTKDGEKVVLSDKEQAISVTCGKSKTTFDSKNEKLRLSYGDNTEVVLEDGKILVKGNNAEVRIDSDGNINLNTKKDIVAEAKNIRVHNTETINVNVYDNVHITAKDPEDPTKGTITLDSRYINLGG